MKFKNYEIEMLINFLFDMKLKGKQSRMRTRLINILNVYLKETLDPERNEMIQSYAEKDNKGEPVFSEDGNKIILQKDRLQEFHVEMDALMNEDFAIDLTDFNLEILISVGHSLLECEMELEGRQAMLFDNWCEQFEEVIDQHANKEES